MCDFKNHKLIEIFRSRYLNEYTVVRWCEDCGAVVVDGESDGRVSAGRIMKMRFPKIIK